MRRRDGNGQLSGKLESFRMISSELNFIGALFREGPFLSSRNRLLSQQHLITFIYCTSELKLSFRKGSEILNQNGSAR